MGGLYQVKLLVEQGSDIHAYDDYVLRWSARNGHLEIVKHLVENGASIHAQDDFALIWSAANGHLEVVKYLVIDCNMTIKEETLEYLKVNDLTETIKIIQTSLIV
jgi:ankyrin repeat protein